ncbi:RsmB/NOP family class I SAM-dependent RNA methyltransferase [bacterium]|nr:RsmB/NOP family class I SAM-dependent RNA methyltransferase [bacterium]
METSSRIGNRLKHAANLWQSYVNAQAPRQLDKWLSEILRGEKKFGSQDRRFYSDVLFSAARAITWTAFEQFTELQGFSSLSDFVAATAQQRKTCLAAFLSETADESSLWKKLRTVDSVRVIHNAHQAIGNDDTASGISALNRFAQAIFLENENNHQESDPENLQLLLIAFGIPPAWSDLLMNRIEHSAWSGKETLAFLAQQNTRAPLWIRLNHQDSHAEVDADLRSHDLLVSWLADRRSGIVTGAFGVYQCATFQAGKFEVQDWASQQIAAAVAAKPGEKIWDACAGGGGKTVALAAQLQGKGALYASDIREHKLLEAKRRCQRAGFHNVRTLGWDGNLAPQFGREVFLQAGFDAVLVDAPCSSSGTWRRNPDARLRITDLSARKSLTDLQLKILTSAAQHVRPGGRLVYGTCSWCVEENENVLRQFMSQSGERYVFKDESSPVRLFGAPLADSDTMFASCLTRG